MRQILVFTGVLVGVLTPAVDAWSQTITYGPVLGRGETPDKMIVKWGTSSATDTTTVGYRPLGSTGAFTTVTGTASKDHEVVLTGLPVDSKFEYYVQSGATKSDPPNEFATCPQPSAPMDLVFYGDSRDGKTEHQKIVNDVIAKAPDMVFESGDLYATGTYSGYLSEFFPVTKALVATTPFMAVPGNHDASSNLATNYGLVFPTPRPAGDAWRPYYAFTCGNTMFIGLNGNSPGDATQKAFLQTKLGEAHASADIVHVIVWFHQSAYSPGVNHGDDTAVQTAWVALLEGEPKVSAVFSGHDHIYARLTHGTSKIAYVVSGGAGAPYYSVNDSSTVATVQKSVGGSTEYNFVAVHIAGGVLTGTAYNDVSSQIDTFTVTQSVPGGGGGGGGGGGSDGGAGGGGTGGGGGGTNGGTNGDGTNPGDVKTTQGCDMGGGSASAGGALLMILLVGSALLRRRRA